MTEFANGVAGVTVEISFSSNPDDPGQDWVDVTPWLDTTSDITYTRGRPDEASSIGPGRLSLVLDNSDGRFTWGNTSSPYNPNVQPRKRIRVWVNEDLGWRFLRFDGYIEGWPVRYAGGDAAQARVQITAADRLDRFGRTRVLRDALHEEFDTATYSGAVWVLDDTSKSVLDSTTILSASILWLYGLQESAGSTIAGDVSGAAGRPNLTLSQVGTGGTAEFGSSGIMPEGTALLFTPASANNGLVLTHTVTPHSPIGAEWSLWCQFAWTGSTGVSLVSVGNIWQYATITATPTTVSVTVRHIGGPITGTVTVAKTVATNDNRPHFALVTVVAGTIYLYVDELAAATADASDLTGSGSAHGITIGGTTSADPHQVAWAGFAASATSAARAAQLASAASGAAERSDLRVARILRWLGIMDTDLETGQSEIAYQATGGSTALDLINAINAVEGGRLFATFDGHIRFQSRGRERFLFTVDPADIVPDDFEIAVDDTSLLNDYTVSRPSGSTIRVRNEESVVKYGSASRAETLYAVDDDALRDAASWRVSQYAQPTPRVPAVTLDLLTTASVYTRLVALFAELGDTVVIAGLDATTTPGTVTDLSLTIEGISEVIGPARHTITYATSPFWGRTWELDDTTYSVLDSTTVLAY